MKCATRLNRKSIYISSKENRNGEVLLLPGISFTNVMKEYMKPESLWFGLFLFLRISRAMGSFT